MASKSRETGRGLGPSREKGEGSAQAGFSSHGKDRVFERWLRWWERISWLRKVGPLIVAAAYAGVLAGASRLGAGHLIVLGVLLLLSYAGPVAAGLLHFVLPLGLVALVYDSMALYKERIRGAVHILEPYRFDLEWFGVQGSDGLLMTPNEFWRSHPNVFLDLYSGFFYIGFLGLFIGTAAYLRFLHPVTSRRDEARYPGWAFLWTNLAGYATYFIYPAAPPWYVARYGLGPLQTQVSPSAAGGLRFDSLLGVRWFEGFYSQSQDVFGSIPSLHVAYPLILVYFAFQLGVARIWSLVFYGSMCFAAIYLDHHYVLDLLVGSLYALGVCAVVSWTARRRRFKRLRMASAGSWRGAEDDLSADQNSA